VNNAIEFVDSRIRRYQMGYIKLAFPITHVLYSKRLPIYISNFSIRRLKPFSLTSIGTSHFKTPTHTLTISNVIPIPHIIRRFIFFNNFLVRIIFILNFIPFFCFVKDFITKKILLSDGLSWLFRVFNHVCSLGFTVKLLWRLSTGGKDILVQRF